MELVSLTSIAAGDRSARYRVIGTLTAGSYGKVRVAIDAMTNVKVAIKAQESPSDKAVRELALYSALSSHPHPHVACMLDYFTTTGSGAHQLLHTVHPLCDSSLWHVCSKDPSVQRGLIADAQWSRYTREMCSGMGHLHSLSIVHGDASLANFLVSGGAVKLADFGCAFAATSLLTTYDVCTLYVRAPEAHLHDRRATFALDVWAIGVCSLALRTGPPPWLFTDCRKDEFAMLIKLVEIFGPITEKSWPHHCCLKAWAQFRQTHCERLAAATQACSGDSWWPRYRSQVGAYLGNHELQEDVLALIDAMLCWDPEGRVSMSAALRFAAVQGSEEAGCRWPSSAGSSGATGTACGPRTPEEGQKPHALAREASTGHDPQGGQEPPALARGASDEGALGLCRCSGNCGMAKCITAKKGIMAKKTLATQICHEATLPGKRYHFFFLQMRNSC